MRIVVASIVVACVAAATLASTATAATPTVRVVTAPSLTVRGTGFVPRTIVRLRLVRAGDVVRSVRVRAGSRGGFLVRFPALEACSVTAITASGQRERRARVPAAWFVRECPPPPPLGPAP